MTRWLLDTTYILPFFGLDVKIDGIKQALEKVLVSRQHDIAITSLSIIEAKWIGIKEFNQIKDRKILERVNLAIESLSSGQYIKIIDPWRVKEAATAADQLLLSGHKDYFDCWIAGVAKNENRVLVTEDEPLIHFIKDKARWPEFVAISWAGFVDAIDNA